MQQQSINNEAAPVGQYLPQVVEEIEVRSSGRSFIEANTIEGSLYEINNTHLIPVFLRENQPLISQGEFIDIAMQAVSNVFHGERILSPSIRLSHPIKGRIPEARNKPANQLQDWEKTLYYERLAFLIEVPGICTDVAGNKLTLSVGGVKCYSAENLMSKSYEQSFKVFIGFQNKVCTNMCVSTDGLITQLKVKDLDALYNGIKYLFRDFNAVQFADHLNEFPGYELSEQQFAHLIGRARMYRHMPDGLKTEIPELLFGDAAINSICRDYYSDNSFCSSPDGSINLWRLYNLFTGANRNSYIDSYLDRAANAYNIVSHLKDALNGKATSWYLK